MFNDNSSQIQSLREKIDKLYPFYLEINEQLGNPFQSFLISNNFHCLSHKYKKFHSKLLHEYLNLIIQKRPDFTQHQISILLSKNFFKIFFESYKFRHPSMNNITGFINELLDNDVIKIHGEYSGSNVYFALFLKPYSPEDLIRILCEEQHYHLNKSIKNGFQHYLNNVIQFGIAYSLMDDYIPTQVINYLGNSYDSLKIKSVLNATKGFQHSSLIESNPHVAQCFDKINTHLFNLLNTDKSSHQEFYDYFNPMIKFISFFRPSLFQEDLFFSFFQNNIEKLHFNELSQILFDNKHLEYPYSNKKDYQHLLNSLTDAARSKLVYDTLVIQHNSFLNSRRIVISKIHFRNFFNLESNYHFSFNGLQIKVLNQDNQIEILITVAQPIILSNSCILEKLSSIDTTSFSVYSCINSINSLNNAKYRENHLHKKLNNYEKINNEIHDKNSNEIKIKKKI